VQYAYVIEWEKHHGTRKLDTDSAEDMTWVYERARERGELFGIQGVTYMLTMGVVKNIIPAIASTNALISAACVLEALKVATYISHPVDNYMMYMGQTGIHVHTFKYERNPDCLICSRKPVTLSITPATTLQQFFETITAQLQLAAPSASSSNGILYIRKPAALEKQHHFKLELTFEQLLAKGLFTTGEPIIVTDSSIEGSVTINVTFSS
jgi:ubiquitin-activating enzyme E1 C